MAISVKQFPNPLNCDEPAYEIQVMYDSDVSNGGANICNGGGTLTNIYGDFATLADIYSNSSTTNAAEGDICDDGMDVIFVVDYTASMGGAIAGVKSGIADIATEIIAQTAGNYRLGLVLYDEYNTTGSSSTILYSTSGYYQNLPTDQKIIDVNGTKRQVYTCPEKMASVGNITTFTNNLNSIATGTGGNGNSSTGMSLGNGVGGAEPGGLATYKAAINSFAGQWRSGVLKVIIHITDNYPGGSDDSYTATDLNYFQNTLTPALDNNNIQFFHNSDDGENTGPNIAYKYLVENTTPAGLGNYAVNYSNSNWTTALEQGLEDLCNETTTYTCDPAVAGWYAETPIVGGTTTAYYWNGSAWTVQYACPAPQFTVQVDFIDNVSNGSVDDFAINLANQYDLDTLQFTGETGDVFSATAAVSVDSGWQNMSLSVSNVSDTNIITNTSVDNGNLEVTIQVTIGSSDQIGANAESLQINGTASQVPRTLRVDVINSTIDTQDANAATQTPAGYVDMTLVEPSNGWTNMGATYNNFAWRYDFTDTPGEVYNFDVEFIPSPTDYSLNVQSQIIQSTNIAGAGGNSFQPGLDAISGLTLTTGSSGPDLAGTITIPTESSWVKIYITADVNQPQYNYRLNGTDTITGATATPNSQTFVGYTGAIFPFTIGVNADSGYNNVVVTGATLGLASNNNAITTGPTVNSSNDGAEGVVTMPSGGGNGHVVLGGSANQIVYTYTVTIIDNMSTTSWNQVTFTGPAGSAPTAANNISPFSDAEYSYNAQTISNNSSGGILTSTIASASTPSINLSLSAMPLGGGSATVTLTGTQTQIAYTFNLSITENPNATNGSWASSSATLTGYAQQVITGTFTWNAASGYEYLASGHSSSDAAITDSSFPNANSITTDYEVTMPSGGGSGVITVDDYEENQQLETYILGFDTSASPSFANNATITSTPPLTLTGEAGSSVSWQYTINPSPSYYIIDQFNTGQIVTYSGNSNPGSPYNNTGTEIAVGYTSGVGGSNAMLVGGSVTMPTGGGSGSIMPTQKATIQPPTETFTITVVNNISNTTFTPSSPILLSGVPGSSLAQTIDVVADSGYSHDVTFVQVSNNYSNTVSASATLGEDVNFTGSMPVGGGSTTITINGTSTPTIAYANFNFTETAGGQSEAEGDWDNAIIMVSGTPGSTHSISNYWRTTNNGKGNSFQNASVTSVTRTGTNYPAQDPFNGTLIYQQPTSGNDARTLGTFTMPAGGGTWGFEFNSTRLAATTTTNPCDCTDYLGGNPPLVAKQDAVNGGSNGMFDISWTTACGAIISTVDVTVDYGFGYQTYSTLPSTNNVTFKRWTNVPAGNYRVTVQYDGSPCIGEIDVIDIVIQNQIITTSTTSSGPRGGQGLSPGPT